MLVSTDGGATFEERTPPSAPLDVDLDPRDPRRIAITTADGLFVSRHQGRTWRRRDALTAETHLAWSDDGRLYRVDASGTVQVSDDGGERWCRAGDAGGAPTTVTVDAEGRLYVALPARSSRARTAAGGRSSG